jgi:putative SOS response-associated peptidase YedK
MCTNFALIKKNGAVELSEKLRVDSSEFHYSANIAPGNLISMVRSREGARQVLPATWWLYLQQTDQGLKPHKNYFSVNTNYNKLPKKSEYKKTRCIIPATAFVESQDGKSPHLLEPADGSAIAFGGLYKEWIDKVTGEIIYSASIITLNGHKALENIHRKSTPLWLPDEAIDDWLDDNITDTAMFAALLVPSLRAPLTATPIDKTMSKNPIGEPFLVQEK